MRQKIDALIAKEVTRHEFLKLIGVAVLSLFGITGLLGVLTQKDATSKENLGAGFGRGTFGR